MRWKYKSLRCYMKGRKLSTSHVLENCDIVIDGDSYFSDISYRNNKNDSISRSNYDQYADLLIHNLSHLLAKKIHCYFIFKGAPKHDLEKRKEIQQNIINESSNFERPRYLQSIFVKDVQKQVLNEINIKYFVCEYDSIEAIIGVARKFKCPVLTNKIEYCLLGVSCIPTNSLEYDKTSNKINCCIYEHEVIRTDFGVYNKMPVLLTLLNESGEYIENLTGLDICGPRDVLPVIRWVKRNQGDILVSAISSTIHDEDAKKTLKELYDKIQELYLFPLCTLAVKYFQRMRPHGLFKDDKKWFAKGVSNGRIAVPYIDLKKKAIISGSSLVNDLERPDALLAAIDIIAYSHCLLTNSQESIITFVGRKFSSSSVWKINSQFDTKISNRDIFTNHRSGRRTFNLTLGLSNCFQEFLNKTLPGYNTNLPLLKLSPNCWILILSLVYYVHKKNKNFLNGAYSVLLSYFLLGTLSETIDLFLIFGEQDPRVDSANMIIYNSLQFLFKRIHESKYNSEIVHDFSEFQHCLQHMNYLNKLCGEKIPCTVYHDTYNADVVYNTFLFMKDKDHLISFIESKCKDSALRTTFKDIVTGFDNCLAAVKDNA